MAYIMGFYRKMLPERKYAEYSASSRKLRYADDIEDYTIYNEIHIGKYYNCGKNRKLIEKIFKITNIIVGGQLLISIILFFSI